MKKLLSFLLLMTIPIGYAQQVADTLYNPPLYKTEYAKKQGSVVFIDEGHHNFHTKDGRYRSFARLLERDGYQVKSFRGHFSRKKLNQGKILVISNALNERNVQSWSKPVLSAFTDDEIRVLEEWVREGGSLFLIADHMPMGGAAKKLAAAFQFEFTDGFALDSLSRVGYFNRHERSLQNNTITNGRSEQERVNEIATFTGQAFKIPEYAKPILILNERYVNKLPETAWNFTPDTPSHSVEGWSQGAYAPYGRGRIVFFGEAAMFSAQLAGSDMRKMGMNREDAKDNHKLLLNIIHWLDFKMD